MGFLQGGVDSKLPELRPPTLNVFKSEISNSPFVLVPLLMPSRFKKADKLIAPYLSPYLTITSCQTLQNHVRIDTISDNVTFI